MDYRDLPREVNKRPRRKLEISKARAAAEVVQQSSLAIEHLHLPAPSLNNVEVAFGIEPDAFGTEHVPGAIAKLANGVLEVAGAVEHLHPEIHRIHNNQSRPV